MDMEETIQNAVTACERAMNNFGDKSGLARGLCNMHPTLQQSLMSSLVLGVTSIMAKKYAEGNYDPRNQAACKVASVMWEAVKNEYNITGDNGFSLPCI